ncbi:MAG TPA: hypothetical protein VF808_10770 [Ktedonobacterales bacterium]
MGWLWNGRGKPRSRPRVARAIVEAHNAHANGVVNLGGATAVMERAIWTHSLPATNNSAPRGGWELASASAPDGFRIGAPAPARRHDFGDVGLLLERAEDTARRLGRSRAEMWEEALRVWLDAQPALALDGPPSADGVRTVDEGERSAPRPWLFEARRQRVWGEIDETLGALRTA